MNRILDRLTLVYPSWTAFTEARADVSTKPQVEGATARVAAAEADPRATKKEAAPRRSRSRVRRARQGQGITERG